MASDSMILLGPISSGVAAGADGVATNNQTTVQVISGLIYGIYVKYNGDKPATTDLTIATLGTSPAAPATTLLTLTNANTDGWFYPRVTTDTTAGVETATDFTMIAVHDKIKVTVAQANTDDYVEVWLMVQ